MYSMELRDIEKLYASLVGNGRGLFLSGYSIASLQWSPVVSLAAPFLTSASSAAQCRFWLHVGCCVLLRGASFWFLGPVWLLCSEGLFRLWVHQHRMISLLSYVPC